MTSIIERLEPRQLFSAYFVDASFGSDANSGRSPRAAWGSLTAVNNASFHKGDRVFLTGTFTNQTLILGQNAAGVSVNSYLPNRNRKAVKLGAANAAVFADEEGDGIVITASNISIANITITAAADALATGNYNYGVYLHNATSNVLSNETINHVVASGFSYSGLCMQGWNTSAADSAGFSNVLIENSSFFNNQVSGLFAAAGDTTGNEFQPAFPATLYLNSHLTIRNCTAYNNAGYNAALQGTPDGININQGNYTSGGIFISSVNGAVVQHCTVYNNCFDSLGSVGTWTFDSTRIDFQNDTSYENKTFGNGDGDGFDFDHGTTDSIMQYDYSHGNDGVGFLIATTGGSSTNNGDTIRYCVTDDDGGGIGVVSHTGIPVLYANIYNNTVIVSDTAPGNSDAIGVVGDPGAVVNVLNNVFYSAGSDSIVVITVADPMITFDRNDYWLAGSPGGFNGYYAGTIYNTLADWSAASGGLETVDGKSLGLIQNPMLNGQAVGRSSPLQREGLNLASRDWAGTAPFDLNTPYNLAGKAWNGLGNVNFFGRPANRRALGAG